MNAFPIPALSPLPRRLPLQGPPTDCWCQTGFICFISLGPSPSGENSYLTSLLRLLPFPICSSLRICIQQRRTQFWIRKRNVYFGIDLTFAILRKNCSHSHERFFIKAVFVFVFCASGLLTYMLYVFTSLPHCVRAHGGVLPSPDQTLRTYY